MILQCKSCWVNCRLVDDVGLMIKDASKCQCPNGCHGPKLQATLT